MSVLCYSLSSSGGLDHKAFIRVWRDQGWGWNCKLNLSRTDRLEGGGPGTQWWDSSPSNVISVSVSLSPSQHLTTQNEIPRYYWLVIFSLMWSPSLIASEKLEFLSITALQNTSSGALEETPSGRNRLHWIAAYLFIRFIGDIFLSNEKLMENAKCSRCTRSFFISKWLFSPGWGLQLKLVEMWTWRSCPGEN